MKKIVTLIFFFVMCFSLSACGNDNNEKNNENTSSNDNNFENDYQAVVDHIKMYGIKKYDAGEYDQLEIFNTKTYCLFLLLYDEDDGIITIRSSYVTTYENHYEYLTSYIYWNYGNAGTYSAGICFQTQGKYGGETEILAEATSLVANVTSANWKLTNWVYVKGDPVPQYIKDVIVNNYNIATPEDLKKVQDYFRNWNLSFR